VLNLRQLAQGGLEPVPGLAQGNLDNRRAAELLP